MAAKWKRVLLSLISSIFVEALVCAVLAIRSMYATGDSFDLKGFLQLFCYEGILVGWFSSPGWVLALPAILLFIDLRAWRLWTLLALGVAIGPFTVIAWGIFIHHATGLGKISFYFSILISTLSTLIYLLLLRRAQHSINQC